jgi:hypothetical protein
MKRNMPLAFAGVTLATFLLSFLGCGAQMSHPAEIIDAQMSLGLDANRRPVEITSEFPPGTLEVYCWFSWKNANPGLQITARWYYTSGNIHILDYPLTLTRVSDNGALSLRMPPGKTLPAGSYRLDLEVKGKVLKSVSFIILEASPSSS